MVVGCGRQYCSNHDAEIDAEVTDAEDKQQQQKFWRREENDRVLAEPHQNIRQMMTGPKMTNARCVESTGVVVACARAGFSLITVCVTLQPQFFGPAKR